jgi:hypothetical protein
MTLRGSDRNWPARSLEWGSDTRQLIQIYLDSERTPLYNVWVCAYQDRDNKRFLKRQSLATGATIEEVLGTLAQRLDQGRDMVSSWTADELEVVADPPGSERYEREQRRNRLLFWIASMALVAILVAIVWWFLSASAG